MNSDGSHTIRLKITNVNTTRYILTKLISYILQL